MILGLRRKTDPLNVAKPPRPRWEDYTTQGLKMMAASRSGSCPSSPLLTEAVRVYLNDCQTERARRWSAR